MSKSFSKQVAERIETLNEEIASMKTSYSMVKSQAAKDAIEAKLEQAESCRRKLRGF